jgi:hypothetical protein
MQPSNSGYVSHSQSFFFSGKLLSSALTSANSLIQSVLTICITLAQIPEKEGDSSMFSDLTLFNEPELKTETLTLMVRGGVKMSKFSMGNLVMTRTINDTITESAVFADEINSALRRYVLCDWGDLCDDDKKLNDDAVETGEDRIFAAYVTTEGKIYIITEWDRSYTTILFPNEY